MALTQVSTNGIKDATIATADIAADAITGAKIVDNAVDSEHYTDGSIDTAHIADDAVTADKLANSINTEIAANTAKTSNATHTGEVTGSGALTIANDAVTGAKIADDAIDSEHYTDGSIDTAHLANDAVTGAKIADDAVGAEHIEDLDANVKWLDDKKAIFGTDGDDLQIYHDGSHSYVNHVGTGNFYIYSNGVNDLVLRADSSKESVKCIHDGAVELYEDGNKKFETTGTGVKVTGTLEQTEFCMDEWRTNDEIRGTHATIGSGGGLWERTDSTGMATHLIDGSTGMTESNGVFTFPKTGKWHVDMFWRVYTASSQADTIMMVLTYLSTNSGTSWIEMATGAESAAVGSSHATLSSLCTLDIENTSTHKVKFATAAGYNDQSSGSYYWGADDTPPTNKNLIRFTRIGDT